MLRQTLENKIGEVAYRARLANQQLGNINIFPNEPGKVEFKKILSGRISSTKKTFKELQKLGVTLSPYLEIGSEHCLRATILTSEFGAKGFAMDISFNSLLNAPRFAKLFEFKKVPKTVCADAENLPFKSSSFPFLFIYETLHHFPDPILVIKEAYRILNPGGILFIGAEPVKQGFQVKFWRRPTKLRFWEKILKYTLILPFISHIGGTEVNHGILEEAFSLKTWEKALAVFNKVEAKFSLPIGIGERIFKNSAKKEFELSFPTRAILWCLGGGLEAICQKEGRMLSKSSIKLDNLFICPACKKTINKEVILKKNGDLKYTCGVCKTTYIKKSGVLVLLEKSLEKKLLG